MKELDKNINRFFKICSKRIKLNIILQNIMFFTLISIILILIVSILELFIPIYMDVEIYEGIGLLSFIACIINYYLKLKPSDKEIALIIDSKGLQERIITSLEFKDNELDIAIAQKKDTVKLISKFNVKENLPIKINIKQMGSISVLLILFIIINSIPTTSKLKALDIREFKNTNKELVKIIEENKKTIAIDKSLTKEEQDKINKEIENSIKEIQKSKNKLDSEKNLDKLEKKLENIEKEIKSKTGQETVKDIRNNIALNNNISRNSESIKQLKEIQKQLSKIESTKDLAKALDHGNKDTIKKELNNLNDKLKNMTSGDKLKISNALSDIATKLPEGDLKQAMENASTQVTTGNLNSKDLENAITSLSELATGTTDCDGNHSPGGT